MKNVKCGVVWQQCINEAGNILAIHPSIGTQRTICIFVQLFLEGATLLKPKGRSLPKEVDEDKKVSVVVEDVPETSVRVNPSSEFPEGHVWESFLQIAHTAPPCCPLPSSSPHRCITQADIAPRRQDIYGAPYRRRGSQSYSRSPAPSPSPLPATPSARMASCASYSSPYTPLAPRPHPVPPASLTQDLNGGTDGPWVGGPEPGVGTREP